MNQVEGSIKITSANAVGIQDEGDQDTKIQQTNKNTITKLWSTAGTTALYISINVTARTLWNREGFLPLHGFFDQFSAHEAAVLGILSGMPLLAIVLFLSFRYLTTAKESVWYKRMPAAFNLGINLDTIEGKAYQRLFLFLFVITPCVAQLHFLLEFFSLQPTRAGQPLTMWAFDSKALIKMFYTHSGYKYDGMEFYPLLEPAFFLSTSIVLTFSCMMLLWRLFMG